MAYVDGNEVWVATNDGSQRARLSSGEGDWRQVAQSDLGYIVGVELESPLSQLSRFAVWDPNGNRIKSGALGASLTGEMTYPLSLDLTPDAGLIVYGFKEEISNPAPALNEGFFVKGSSDPSNAEPTRIPNVRFPTLSGTRVVGSIGPEVVGVQNPSSTLNSTFSAWIDIPAGGRELRRTDVPATGDALALEFKYDGAGTRIGLLAASAVGVLPTFPAAFDCFINTDTTATNPSWLQDGSAIAWQDAGGVKIGGRPINASDPCVLAHGPMTISTTGKSPSMGPFDVARYLSAHQQPPVVLPINPTVIAPRSAKLAAFLKSGLAVKVSHPGGGKVTLTLTVMPKQVGKRGSKPITIATAKGSLVAGKTSSLKLKFTKTGKGLKKKLKGDKATLTVTAGGGTTTKSIKLK